MRYRYVAAAVLIGAILALGAVWLWQSGQSIVLHGAGPIANQEGSLFIEATLLMLVVAIPVIGLLFFFAWYYRAGNTNARFEPEWENSAMDELVWWAVPLEIILVLGALTWFSTHTLDPHKALPAASGVSAVEVQVVALPFKWLFIYPDLNIATVNFLEIPVGTPVNLHITADAPMNSFWVPQLGGQIYAMPGMVNPLSLQADSPGDYRGSSANYSGTGFASMHFTVRAVPPSQFASWLEQTQAASTTLLDQVEYQALASYPSDAPPGYYGAVTPGIFNTLLNRYDWGITSGGVHTH